MTGLTAAICVGGEDGLAGEAIWCFDLSIEAFSRVFEGFEPACDTLAAALLVLSGWWAAASVALPLLGSTLLLGTASDG